MVPAKYRYYVYLVAFALGLLAAIAVLFGKFTPDQIQTALVVLGIVFAGVAGLAAKNVPTE